MFLNKSIFILFFVLLVSCKSQGPRQVWLYNEDGAEMLNGNVKEILIGDSLKGDFNVVHFDEQGNMSVSSERRTSTSITVPEKDTIRDTSVDNIKTTYTFFYNQGHIKAIKYKVSGSCNSCPGYSGIFEFDSQGHLATKGNPRDSTGEMIYYKCDTTGYVFKSTEVHRGQLAESEVYGYKHDNKHLLIEKTSSEGNVLLDRRIFEYKAFDSNHNWIKKICRLHDYNPGGHCDSATFTVTRKITYY
jgi:hypothetical protein